MTFLLWTFLYLCFDQMVGRLDGCMPMCIIFVLLLLLYTMHAYMLDLCAQSPQDAQTVSMSTMADDVSLSSLGLEVPCAMKS